MMIPGPPPGTNAEDGAAGVERPSSDAPESPPTAPRVAAVAALAYADFAAALKDALRDFHSADLLARKARGGEGHRSAIGHIPDDKPDAVGVCVGVESGN
jgi:hypothetical protein